MDTNHCKHPLPAHTRTHHRRPHHHQDVINEPIPTTSVQAVEAVIKAFDAATPERLATITAMHEEVLVIAAELTEVS